MFLIKYIIRYFTRVGDTEEVAENIVMLFNTYQ